MPEAEQEEKGAKGAVRADQAMRYDQREMNEGRQQGLFTTPPVVENLGSLTRTQASDEVLRCLLNVAHAARQGAPANTDPVLTEILEHASEASIYLGRLREAKEN